MKSLIQYILEEYNSYRCTDVHIEYDILNINNKRNKTNELSFEVPSSYSEDDFQIYLQDLYLEKLPGNNKATQEKLGKNYDNIIDTNFEYREYTKSEEKPDTYIEWQESYDNHINKDEDEFGYVTIIDLKYNMEFSEFDIDSESEFTIEDDIIQIFSTMNIQDDKELPFDLTLNEKNISYE